MARRTYTRRKTRVVRIGPVRIGGRHPVAVQSMTKTRTSDVEATVRQIALLAAAGCEIIRCAVKDEADARAIAAIRPRIGIPLVADIHFDWRLAMAALEAGADKIRLNPGNLEDRKRVVEICRLAAHKRVPLRVGLNSGSAGEGSDQVAVMVSKARRYLRILEGLDFHDIVLSLKCQTVRDTVRAYRMMAPLCDYPFHLGVTATGTAFKGMIKSSVAVGGLLLDGIGDTVRISLTADPAEEIGVAQALLESLELRCFGPEVISCPTCGRCSVDLVAIVKELESALARARAAGVVPAKRLTVAVMGCEVNGPGEARHADLGIAFGRGTGLMFRKGRPVRKVAAGEAVNVLLEEIKKETA